MITASTIGHEGTIGRGGSSARRGFTLIELIVVIAVLGLLMSMVMFALSGARNRAKVARTRATIKKIDHHLRDRWDEYATRRVSVNTANLPPGQAAQRRLRAVRELMRLEMPDRWKDVTEDPRILPRRPAASQAYLRKYKNSRSAGQGNSQGGRSRSHRFVNKYQNAECLYMIMMTRSGGQESAREQFATGDVDDIDGDGFPEIVDGWGNPIRFLRWAPGFSLSELQLPVDLRETPMAYAGLRSSNKTRHAEYHDPLDPSGKQDNAFQLIPLVYSSGPDGIADIYSGPPEAEVSYPRDPYEEGMRTGRPEDLPDFRQGAKNDDENWWDNIHSHTSGASIK